MPDSHAAVPPLVISRSFAAPRALVFRAWTTAEHVKRWFSPETFTVAEADIDCRAGGVFAVCMRAPDGRTHWCRGHFTDVAPPEHLAFSTDVTDGETLMFVAHTAVAFEDDGAGTRMTVRQSYELPDEFVPLGCRRCAGRLAHHARQVHLRGRADAGTLRRA